MESTINVSKPCKILVCGTVPREKFSAFKKRITRLHSGKSGPFDLLICLGGIYPTDTLPLDTVCLSYSSPTDSVVEQENVSSPNKTKGEKNPIMLVGSGITHICGIYVGYHVEVREKLSDITTLFNSDELNAVGRGVDVLLTREWPSNVLSHVDATDSSSIPSSFNTFADFFTAQASAGNETSNRLAALLKPRYHFTPASFFYERVPYINSHPSPHLTRFISIANYGNSDKQKSVYAARLSCTLNVMEETELYGSRTPKATLSPYTTSISHTSKRPRTSHTTSNGLLPTPPHDQRIQRRRIERRGGTTGHSRYGGGDPSNQGTKGAYKATSKRVPGPCWFCLSSPDVEKFGAKDLTIKHILCDTGNTVYLALAKGGLVPFHLLIIPVDHVETTSVLPSQCVNEISLYKKALCKFFASMGKCMVLFERYSPMRNPQHTHIQVMPVSIDQAKSAVELFEAQGAARGFKFRREKATKPTDEKNVIKEKDVVKEYYFKVEVMMDDSQVKHLVHYINSQERFPFQFGRETVAELMGMPERSNWRACSLPTNEEKAVALDFKAKFASFDWSLK